MRKKIFFTPGPTQLAPKASFFIKKAIEDDIGSISHRGEIFKKIFKEAIFNLRKILNLPETHEIAFLSSSIEAMEVIILSMVKKKSFHFINGAFSKKWYLMAKNLGKESDYFEFSQSNSILNAKITKKPELLCLTHNETSIGMMVPMDEIYQIKKKYYDIPLALDVVSSFPYPKIDFNFVDILFFSVQKGLGLPAGLSVIVVNKKYSEKTSGGFHDFKSLFSKARIFQTPETPNVLGIYLLAKITKEIIKKNVEQIRKEIDIKSNLLYNYFSSSLIGRPFIKEFCYRSKTTIVIDVGNRTDFIVKKLEKEGFIIGKGYGQYKENHIRIANFPQHTISMIKKLIGIINKIEKSF